MRQSGRSPNGQVGIEGLVEILLETVARQLRQKLLGDRGSRKAQVGELAGLRRGELAMVRRAESFIT
jgi:hypothetical protein